MRLAVAAALIMLTCWPLWSSQNSEAWWRHADASAAMAQDDGRTRGAASPEQISIQIPTPAAATDVPSTVHITGEYFLGVLIGLIGFLGRRNIKAQDKLIAEKAAAQDAKNKEYDGHLKDCNAKAVNHATFQGEVDAAHQKTQGQIALLDLRCARTETMIEKMDVKLDRLLDRK